MTSYSPGVIVFRAAFNAGHYLVPAPDNSTFSTQEEIDRAWQARTDNNALYTSVLSSVLNSIAIMLLGFVSSLRF